VLGQAGQGASASRRRRLFFAESSLEWELGWWYALLYSAFGQMVIEGELSYKEGRISVTVLVFRVCQLGARNIITGFFGLLFYYHIPIVATLLTRSNNKNVPITSPR